MNSTLPVLLLLLLACGPAWPPSPLPGGGAGGSGGAGDVPDAGIPEPVSSAEDVMPVLKAKCGNCHQGQYLDPVVTLARLHATTSAMAACANTPRIVINDGANSLLVKKLLGTAECGGVMPLVKVGSMTMACEGDACVAPADIEKMKAWIDQGALDN